MIGEARIVSAGMPLVALGTPKQQKAAGEAAFVVDHMLSYSWIRQGLFCWSCAYWTCSDLENQTIELGLGSVLDGYRLLGMNPDGREPVEAIRFGAIGNAEELL